MNADRIISGYHLVMTCGACPEQYDVFFEDVQVGYLRLRHGYFTARCPDSSGDLVYEAEPHGDGIFEYDEREGYLEKALAAIGEWIKGHQRKEVK